MESNIQRDWDILEGGFVAYIDDDFEGAKDPIDNILSNCRKC